MAVGNVFSGGGQTGENNNGGIKMPDFVRPISRSDSPPTGYRRNPFTPPEPPKEAPKEPPRPIGDGRAESRPPKLSLGGILNMLGMKDRKLDNDIIIILMLFLIISSDGGDDLLALALAYIIL